MIIIEFKREMGDFEICNEHEKHLGERGEEYGVGRDEGNVLRCSRTQFTNLADVLSSYRSHIMYK